MKPISELSRRDFLAASGAVVAATSGRRDSRPRQTPSRIAVRVEARDRRRPEGRAGKAHASQTLGRARARAAERGHRTEHDVLLARAADEAVHRAVPRSLPGEVRDDVLLRHGRTAHRGRRCRHRAGRRGDHDRHHRRRHRDRRALPARRAGVRRPRCTTRTTSIRPTSSGRSRRRPRRSSRSTWPAIRAAWTS